MAQWVKNPTAAARGRGGGWWCLSRGVGSIPSPCSGLKDQALPQLWRGSQLWLRFNPWPRERNFFFLSFGG